MFCFSFCASFIIFAFPCVERVFPHWELGCFIVVVKLSGSKEMPLIFFSVNIMCGVVGVTSNFSLCKLMSAGSL